MAQADADRTISRYDNLPVEQIADMLGAVDAQLKGVEAEVAALKAEIRRRGVADVTGKNFTVTVRGQITKRLDVPAVRQFLGEAVARFEVPSLTQVVRIRAVQRLAAA